MASRGPIWTAALAAVFVFAAPLCGSKPQKQAATFKAHARLVTVNVVVQDRDGNPVTGLTKDDFTIEDGGKPQKITFFSAIPNQPVKPMAKTTVLCVVFRDFNSDLVGSVRIPLEKYQAAQPSH